jgi:hypothetical protein
VCLCALITAAINVIMTFSFVENTMGTNMHVAVPVLTELGSTCGACFSLALGFLAMNLSYYEVKRGEDRPQDSQYHIH